MRDHELIARFMRLGERRGRIVLEVAVVMWHGAYDPYLEWQVFHRWLKRPSPGRLCIVQRKALATPDLFARCLVCGKRNNRGHMVSPVLCHGCAERTLRIVF